MIEFRTLGRLDLRDSSDDRTLTSILVQPKRVALLAYLVVASPRGPKRRDRLLSLFWPEVDAARGRHSLSQALYVLRRGLGNDAIHTRGEEVQADLGLIRCDAVEFEEALEGGRPERGLELYRGDLLDGLFVEGCPEFEQWLDGERRRLRQRAGEAAWGLALRREEEGSPTEAVRWGRLAVGLAPYDEPRLRQLLHLLVRADDRAGMLKEFGRFRDRMTEDLDADPTPETLRLVEELQTAGREDDGGQPATLPSVPSSPVPPKREAPDRPTPLRGQRPPPRVRRASIGVVGGLLALALWFGLPWLGSGNPGEEPPSDRLVVYPFTFSGSEDFRYLSTGVMELLGTALDGAGELRTVYSEAVLAHLRRTGEVRDPVRGREVAGRGLDAGIFVLGSVIETGGRVYIRASIYSSAEPARNGPAPLATAQVEGEATRIFDLVDDLASQLLGAAAVGPDRRLARVASRTTHSLPALKAYLRGEQAYREGNFVAAIEAFREAVEADSTFALAYYRLSLASLWADQQQTNPVDADALAARYAHELGEPDRFLVHGYLHWRRGAPDSAEYQYRRITAAYPTHLEALHQLGETLFHYNPLRGRSIAEARDPFEEVLAMDPEHRSALWHLAQLDALEGDRDGLRVRLERLKALGGGPEVEIQALLAFGFGGREAVEDVMLELHREDEIQVSAVAWRIAVHLGDLAGARRVTRLLTEPERLTWPRMLGHETLAYLNLAEGRFEEAAAELDALDELDEEQVLALESRVLYALHPLAPRDAGRLRELRSRVEEWDVTEVPERLGIGSVRQRQLYLLGLLDAALGNGESAIRRAMTLDAEGAPQFAATIRGKLARDEGRLLEAFRWLEAGQTETWFGLAASDAIHSQAYERFLKAEVLGDLGRGTEALQWYRTFQEHALRDLAYLAPSHLRRARIHAARNEPDRALHHYARFLELWSGADAELAPLREAAELEREALLSRTP